MKCLANIPCLQSVELLLRDEPHRYQKPKDMVQDLAMNLTTLRKVYIRIRLSERTGGEGGYYYHIWELSDEWHGGIVEDLNAWDILQECTYQ
jgi:hypothetical protein